MKIAFNIQVIATMIVIAQGIFACILLLTSDRNRLSNRLLALLILSFSFWMIDTFYNVSGLYQQDPNLYFQPIFFSFAFGPLILFYVKSLTNSNFKFKKRHLLHFIPVIIQALFYVFLSLKDYSYRREFWLEVHQPLLYDIEFDVTLLSLVIYLILSLRILIRYQSWLKENFSEFSEIRLNWLKTLLFSLMFLSVFWGLDAIQKSFFDIYRLYDFSEISLGFVIILLAYGGIMQRSAQDVHFIEEEEMDGFLKPIDQSIILAIEERMETHRDFLNPILNLQEFSSLLSLAPKTVSEHINHGLGLSFVEFVNGYRVQEVLLRIERGDLKEFTLLSIALDSGFNSKSTFNRVFKKTKGESPSAYLSRSQNLT